MVKRCMLFAVIAMAITNLSAQDIGLKKITLQDLSVFAPQAGNWQIVGDVTMDPNIEIHHGDGKPATPAPATKKNKKSKAEVVVVAPEAVTFTAGKGVLLNLNSEAKKDNLITTFQHGDIELSLEVMIPKGSNSGIYLQGRYEVQLLDSWGIKQPKFSDIGGIYRNWESAPDKIYMGKAPMTNPAKAAGLWQKMKISFRAPRFDANGKKIANARFTYVELNGVIIHENVEVPLPTGGPIDSKEVAMGPIMIQGDHGPVAFRNIEYRLMKEITSSISAINYKVYHGNYKLVADFTSQKPALEGTSPDLTAEVIDITNGYGVVYTGTVTVPENDTYTFSAGVTGGVRMIVNGQQIINLERPDDGRVSKGTIALKAGTYPFEIDNFKDADWMPPRLGLQIQSSASYPQTLNAFNSYPPDESPTSAIIIHAGSEPKLLRAFYDFNKDRALRLTHTIGVAEPSAINYIYDLDAGNLVCAWRGDFVDATPMWHDRGDGSFRPLGAVQSLFLNEPLAFLETPAAAFPETGKEGEYRPKGYEIEESTLRPVFKYLYSGLEVSDKIYPEDDNRSLTHEISLKERGTKAVLTYKLAEGSDIVKMANGNYVVDKQYYIKVLSAGTPMIRDANGKKELVVPFDGTTLKYTLIW